MSSMCPTCQGPAEKWTPRAKQMDSVHWGLHVLATSKITFCYSVCVLLPDPVVEWVRAHAGFSYGRSRVLRPTRVQAMTYPIYTRRNLAFRLALLGKGKGWFVQCQDNVMQRYTFTMSVDCHQSVLILIWSLMLLWCKAKPQLNKTNISFCILFICGGSFSLWFHSSE